MPAKRKNWEWAIKLSRYTVVLDANVLYPAPLRDFIIELATAGIFRAKWTEQIHDEWTRNLLANRSDLSSAQLSRTRELMNSAIMDCLVEGYENLIDGLTLPDPDDRHVLAAAIHAGADGIVTFNLKDFPKATMEQFSKEVLHPDDFLHHQFGLDQASVVIAARNCRLRLNAPQKTAAEYLDTLASQKLPKLVAELRPYTAII